MTVSLVIWSIVFIAVVSICLPLVIRYIQTHSRIRVIVFGLWAALLGGLSTVVLSGGYSPWHDEFPGQICQGGLLLGALVGAFTGWSWAGLSGKRLYKSLLLISWIGLTSGMASLHARGFLIYHGYVEDDTGIALPAASAIFLLTLFILAYGINRLMTADGDNQLGSDST